MSPVARSRRRLRPRASTSLSIILFATLAFLSSQLIESAAGAETTTTHSFAGGAQRTRIRHDRGPREGLHPCCPGRTPGHDAGRGHATATAPSTPPPPATPTATTSTTPRPPRFVPAPSAPPPAPPATPAPSPGDPGAVPPVGQASAWGCGAALAYLEAYAAKGFTFECPGYAEGHEAMTCLNVAGACPNAAVIAIADPCPQAYMNETSNSFVITGTSEAPIDPFGPCP